MAKASILLSCVVVLALSSAILPANALFPYARNLWDMMDIDPFRVLEQTPLAIPKGLGMETVALARADWKETANEHIIVLDVPGMKKEDIKIEVEENRVLRISGERKGEGEEEKEGEKWHRVERKNGKFWRQFRLPMNANLDSIKAHLEDGVLKIRVVKVAEEKRKPKVVSIVGEESKGEDVKASKA